MVARRGADEVDTAAYWQPGGQVIAAAENAVRGLGHNCDVDHVQEAVRAAVIDACGGQLVGTVLLDAPSGELDRLRPEYDAAAAPERLAQADLLRDVFGPLPFRSVTLNPSWLTSDATGLAAGIYAERAFDRLPILADALQDAGCDDQGLLDHCRGEGPHVRGCWVVDQVLGKA
jgi:hypothetical protein